MKWLLAVTCVIICSQALPAQDAGGEGSKSNTASRSLDSLKTIVEPISESLAELRKLQAELQEAATEVAQQDIGNRIESERTRIRQLRDNFKDIVGGSEAAEYDVVDESGAGLQQQISELLQPVLSEMREATAQPRELDALRKSLEKWRERKEKSDTVLARIDQLVSRAEDDILVTELKSAKALWSIRQSEAVSQIAIAKVQIEERSLARESLWERFSTGFSAFFRSRGSNLLLAIAAATAGFFASRKLYSWIRRVSPVHKSDRNNFTSRLSDVLALAIAIIVSVAAIILVFYIRGDWLLLTLVVIFLIGVAWAGKKAALPYLEQIRMVLNLGSVREGERVIYLGLPWKVSSLGFFTTFHNPNLQGGTIRLPIRDVMAMISRPPASSEVWFPSMTDDWVILTDGTYGKIIIQTPDQVVILRLGGSMKTYPTADFLELAPENLSRGFRISVTFGIDYRHQSESTVEIPGILNRAITSTLIQAHGRDAIRSIQTEFASASASSLDYQILADFDGSMGHRYYSLQRQIQAVCVDVCNAEGWIIPFQQITVHSVDP